MTCREFWERMPELVAEGQPLDHVRECRGCAVLLERQRALAMGLERMAGQQHDVQAPARVEERLLEAFRANFAAPAGPPPIPAHHGWPRWPAQVSVAAAVMILGVFLVWQRLPRTVQPVAVSESIVALESDSDFVALPNAGESGPAEDADLIRVEMPRSALIALGVPVADGEAGEPLEAEVVLGMGGAPQAVRVLQ